MHESFAYIPEDRRRALCTGAELPDRSAGTALFADLSGFTMLTEGLTRTLGPLQGAEELSRQLTTAYAALIGEVVRYRGSVVGFSGDAITCWFDGDSGPRAVAAGLAMQEAIGRAAGIILGDGTRVTLGVKVAVVRGPVRRFLVGNPDIQLIDVLAGRTLDRLAAAERLAERGEVVVDRDVVTGDPRFIVSGERGAAGLHAVLVEGLSEPVPTAPWESLSFEAFEDEQLRPWLLATVHSRLSLNLGGFLADFRPAAALFLSFRGIDYDGDDQAGTKLDEFVRWVQRTVADYEGTLVQLTIGDKGAYLYCAFGAPIAHDDDASRAVAAARRLRLPPQSFIHELRIGLTYGYMYAGAYGSADRRTYGVLGTKTNMAARLMNRAGPGEILCDRDLAHQAQRHWSFSELAAIPLKGFSEPVPVFTPRERRSEKVVIGESVLIGRQAELARLKGLLDGAAGGRSRLCLLEGEAGIGKSRLVDALLEHAAAQGFLVLRGGGQGLEERMPYGGWRAVFQEILGLRGAADEAQLQAQIAELAPDMARWMPLLNDVLDLDLRETDLTRGLDPKLRRQNLSLLLTELLRARAASKPLLVELDEAHWLDSLSWELIPGVMRAAATTNAPILLVVAHRPLEASSPVGLMLQELRELPFSEAVRLAELEPGAMKELVAGRLGVEPDDVPDRLNALVEARAAGNPFYAEELIRALSEDRLLTVEQTEGRARVAVGKELARGEVLVPGTLQGIVLARIDRLPPKEQLTLKVSAVVGRFVEFTALRATLSPLDPTGEPVLRRRLEGLVSRAFLTADGPEAGQVYSFRQVITHEVVYGTLLFAQRRLLHRTLAEWLELRQEAPNQATFTRLAHHYSQAAEGSGDVALLEKAVTYLVRTADQSARLSAFPEVVAAYRQALGLLPAVEAWAAQRADLLVRLAGAHAKMSEYAAAKEALELGLQLAETVGDDITTIRALSTYCHVYAREGAYEEARAVGQRALALAEALGNHTEAAQTRGRLGVIAANRGEFPLAREHFEAALKHFHSLEKRHSAAPWLNNLGLIHLFSNESDKALERFDEALELAREGGNRELEGQVLANLGLAAEKRGAWDTAGRYLQESLEIFRDLMLRQDAVINVLGLGDIALALGKREEADTLFREAVFEAAALGAVPTALLALRGTAALLAEEGEYLQAAELLGLILDHPSSNAEVKETAEKVLADLKSVLGEVELAQALERGAARSLEEVLQEMPRPAQ